MTGLVRRLAVVIGAGALCLTTGCASFWVYPGSESSSSSSTSGDIAYVANSSAETVSAYVVGTGTLTAVSGSPVSLGFEPTAVAVNPANSVLFVAGSSQIASYAIGTGGVLTLLNSNAMAGLSDVVAMDISPDGNWLFAVDGLVSSTANAVTVYEYQITASTGALSLVTSATTGAIQYSLNASATTAEPLAIKVTPDVSTGQYVLVALGPGGDLVIPFNTSTGAQTTSSVSQIMLTSLSGSPSDNALAVNSSGSIFYVARSYGSSVAGSVVAYNLATLNQLATVSTGVMPYALTLNSAGTDLYVANRSDGTILGFSTAAISTTATSTFTAVGSSVSPGKGVTALAVDNSGDYLFGVGGSPDLAMYSYDTTTTGQLDLSEAITSGGAVAIATTH